MHVVTKQAQAEELWKEKEQLFCRAMKICYEYAIAVQTRAMKIVMCYEYVIAMVVQK